MSHYIRKEYVVEAISFAEFVEYAKSNSEAPNWSFEYKGFPISHETDACYLVPSFTPNKLYDKFTPDDMLLTDDDGQLVSMPIEEFNDKFRKLEDRGTVMAKINSNIIENFFEGKNPTMSEIIEQGINTPSPPSELFKVVVRCKDKHDYIHPIILRRDGVLEYIKEYKEKHKDDGVTFYTIQHNGLQQNDTSYNHTENNTKYENIKEDSIDDNNNKVPILRGCNNTTCFCTGKCNEIIGYRDMLPHEKAWQGTTLLNEPKHKQ